MTPLRKAAIAFSELFSDYAPTEIVEILYGHHYLTRDTDFLARCYSRLELEELREIEEIIEAFFEEVSNESLLEENLTDWQREIIKAINQVIDDSRFSELFSIRNTLTAYDDIAMAMISIEASNNKGILSNVISHFCQLNQEVRRADVKIFIRKLLKGDFIEGDSLESLLPWQQGIVLAIGSIAFLKIFDLLYLDLQAVLLNDNDSSVEGDYKKVEDYDELDSLARFFRDKKNDSYIKDLASDLVELSFISHALGVEFLYSKSVSMAYYLNKRRDLLYEVHEDEIRIAGFTNEQDTSQGLASMAAVTRFINRNSKRVIKEIKDDHIESPMKKGTNGFPDHKQHTYKSVASFDAKVDEVSRRVGPAVEVKSTHKVTGSKNTREHVTQIDPNSDRDVNYNEICRILNDLESRDIKTASLIRQILQNDFSSIAGNESLSQTDIYQLVSITYLLFVCEPSKNPAAFIHHQMLLDLVFYEHINWTDVFGNHMKNPLMPMKPTNSIMRARNLNELYKKYLPVKYQYDDRDGNHEPDLLVRYEAKVVKKWLEEVKGIDKAALGVIKTKEIISLIKASIIDWYGVDLSEEDYYTEDQMIALLKHFSPSSGFTVMPQTQFEHADLLRENLRLAIRDANDDSPTVIPINLHHNHWTGLFIRRQADRRIEVIHVDPLGNTLEDEPNYQLFVQTIQEFAPGAHIVDLGTQHFVQQHNGHDCGPFTVDNLRRLVEAGNQLDNLNAEQIIALGILSQPENGSANHLRNLYELILNPQLNSSTATNVEMEKNLDGSITDENASRLGELLAEEGHFAQQEDEPLVGQMANLGIGDNLVPPEQKEKQKNSQAESEDSQSEGNSGSGSLSPTAMPSLAPSSTPSFAQISYPGYVITDFYEQMLRYESSLLSGENKDDFLSHIFDFK